MSELIDLINASPARNGRILGVVAGVVTNNKDPDKLGRVKVRFPWLSDTDESWWARVASPMAGKDRGVFFLPEVDDEVLVLFEHGDPRFPYVIGALWNGSTPPFLTNDDGKNDKRVIRSRSGHTITLNDKDGEETIEIVDKTGDNSVVISSKDNKLTISASSDISITSANGKVSLSGKGIELTSEADIKLKASSGMNLEASGKAVLKGSTVEIN
ncbi:phage baseplate assembly protein V [Kribbella sp. NBC_01484]|uniref:phage baseplate assembly protein V n=1 Tax=Kribbella sp. NBC_01484 TaxID=2903579 RepID=UPI002E315666|nr:phage baseplate assembly protein V [Kribbella sp. NBC_01484]